MINGISVSGISEFVHEVKESPEEARAAYGVQLTWQSGTRSEVKTLPMMVGTHKVARDFSWTIDEPRQILGLNHGPNPQEYLLSGVGGCLLVGYAVGASVMGIQLEKLEIEVRSELDLRGFLKVDESAPVELKGIQYKVTIAGEGSKEQFEELHKHVAERSPNRMTIAKEIPIEGTLVVE